MLPHPCILEDPECQAHEAKSEVANPPCLLGAQKRAKMVRHPNVLGWHWWQNCNIIFYWFWCLMFVEVARCGRVGVTLGWCKFLGR